MAGNNAGACLSVEGQRYRHCKRFSNGEYLVADDVNFHIGSVRNEFLKQNGKLIRAIDGGQKVIGEFGEFIQGI